MRDRVEHARDPNLEINHDGIEGIVPSHPVKKRLIDGAVRLYAPEIALRGRENLDRALHLHRRETPLVLIGNHLSNADAPILEQSLTRHGYGEIGESLVFLLGRRLKTNTMTRVLTNAFAHIEVWPQTVTPSPEERLLARNMTKSSLEATRRLAEKGGVLVIFGEGTRSRSGKMGSFLPEISHFLKPPGLHVLPFAVMGSEKLLPVGSKRLQRASPRVVFGEPQPAEALFAATNHLPRPQQRQSIVEHLREEVAELLDPSYES